MNFTSTELSIKNTRTELPIIKARQEEKADLRRLGHCFPLGINGGPSFQSLRRISPFLSPAYERTPLSSPRPPEVNPPAPSAAGDETAGEIPYITTTAITVPVTLDGTPCPSPLSQLASPWKCRNPSHHSLPYSGSIVRAKNSPPLSCRRGKNREWRVR